MWILWIKIMKKVVLIALLSFVVTLIQAQKITLKVMQFNIWLEGTEIQNGFEAIVNEVIENDADIVTFNEVLNNKNTRFNDLIVKSLKEKGKIYYSFYSDDSGIISKYPIINSAPVYPEKADTGSIYKAIINVVGTEIALYSAHLDYQKYAPYLPRGYSGNDWKKMEKPVTILDSILKNTLSSKRMDQIKAVIADAENEFNKGNSVIIGGDFNEPSHLDWVKSTKNLFDHNGMIVPWPVSELLSKYGYIDSYRQLYPNPVTHPGFTYPADNPGADINKLTWAPDADERERIDFIFYKPEKGLILKNVAIIGPKGCIVKGKREEEKSLDNFILPSGVWPSDHKAVLATFEITSAQKKTIAQKVDSVLSLMTIEEKIGQLNQYNDDWINTGPVTSDNDIARQIQKGRVGSLLNSMGTERTRSWQTFAMQSRLRIPLLFAQDVIHGYKTTFPIPLAEACSWDLDAIELSARIAATEASASGIHWTFAPMVDIARDPRWGRVMEGAGEDPFLASKIAFARVKGFQGEKPGEINSVMACAKHFAAYGAAIGGRDYNSVDISDRLLWEVYLPPFKSAVDAKVATIMDSFNDINGVPSTGNKYLQRDILKGKWGFEGFVVSDMGSMGEMINHGNAKNEYEAALCAITAGCDMDMESRCYINNLAQLVKDGKVPIAFIDDAVKRILRKKFEMGLFGDPFRFCNPEREKKELNNPDHPIAARDIARKSIVLLKNQNNLLPLSKNIKTVACIGPLVKAVMQNKGFWDVEVPGIDSNYIVSQWEGLKNKIGNKTKLLYAKGCDIEGNNKDGFDEAVTIAKQADVVILSIGERRDMTGEARSRSNIVIPGVQEDLLKELLATGKPVVVLINAGRPLIFNYTADNAPAILYTWWLGSEAGNAIADVLFGDYNPSAKLPITFPLSIGQIPVYYSHFNTSRPAVSDDDRFYKSAYIDLSIYPKFEFGYGLSYTTFQYSNLQLSKQQMKENEQIEVSATITNTGNYDGEEIVQLYLHDIVGSIARPVKELKDFKKLKLKTGESETIKFIIDKEKLSFFNQQMQWVAEPGAFDLMIGASSQDIRLKTVIELLE
jgi:beta-glucosidase